ncbi:aldehyde dehydrogenase family protein [Streptomyces jumonjinensis]|uniref:aldehyde dehydrogenase family protein n=1 Tax=Streptomyces jumonjinensis TaxID=1945 RepID=UPI0037AEFD17
MRLTSSISTRRTPSWPPCEEQPHRGPPYPDGQTCFLGTRVLAPRGRYTEVVDAFTALAGSLTIGPALDPETRVGPLATARQRERVESYIAAGRAAGARLTTGGGRPKGLDRGWFVEPTVFADVDNSSVIAREEIFRRC